MPDTDSVLQAIIGGGLVVAVAKLVEVWYRRRVPAAEARKIDVDGEVALSDAATRAAESLRSTLTAEITSMAARHTIVVNDLEMRIARLEEASTAKDGRIARLEEASTAKDTRIRELEHENTLLTRRVGELECRLLNDERKMGN